ncbi:MAG: electron transport complex subunit RsxC, partial [Endomicrobiia bacterium]
GIHPSDNKVSQYYRLEKIVSPQLVYLHLSQHTGKPAKPIVKPNDYVLIGQKVADYDGLISSPIHSPVSGKVLEFKEILHPVLGNKFPAIVIENDGNNKFVDFNSKYKEYFRYDRTEIVNVIRENGVVGLGGAMFPTHVKLSPKKEIEVVLLNGCECEPYLTCDDKLMQEHAREIVEGLKIIMYVLDAPRAVVVLENNKSESFKKMQEVVSRVPNVTTISVKTKYPQGAEKQLIKTVLGREVPSGGLPMDVGVVVQNVGTSYAIYNAVIKGIPLYERVVTISGDINRIGNFVIPLGTMVRDIVKILNIDTSKTDKLIFGGPMMGVSLPTQEVPVIKGTSGILFLKDKIKDYTYGACIRCSKCIRVCPMRLMPNFLSVYTEYNLWDRVKVFSPNDCIECGCCSYVCVSKRPIVSQIKFAKTKLREIK